MGCCVHYGSHRSRYDASHACSFFSIFSCAEFDIYVCAGDDDDFWIARCEEIVYEDQQDVHVTIFELVDCPYDSTDSDSTFYVMSPYLEERAACIDVSTLLCKVSTRYGTVGLCINSKHVTDN